MNSLEIIQKYYDKESKIYQILVKHSEDVAKKAVEICIKHPELSADKEFVYNAAMIHDIGIKFTNAPGIECYGENKYILHGYLGAELIRKEGYPLHARVCERHTGVGLSNDDIVTCNIPLPKGIYTPCSIEEKIICYADKFYSKSKLNKEKRLEEVIKSLAKHSQKNVDIFLNWHKIFG